MTGFTLIGKVLILMGIFLILLGIIVTVGPKIPWIGRLLGDIIIKKEHFSFYFPLTSCIIISIIINPPVLFLQKIVPNVYLYLIEINRVHFSFDFNRDLCCLYFGKPDFLIFGFLLSQE